MMQLNQPAGAGMRYLFLAFFVALLAVTAVGTGHWPFHDSYDGQTMRTIHYDKGIDLSARRREAQ